MRVGISHSPENPPAALWHARRVFFVLQTKKKLRPAVSSDGGGAELAHVQRRPYFSRSRALASIVLKTLLVRLPRRVCDLGGLIDSAAR